MVLMMLSNGDDEQKEGLALGCACFVGPLGYGCC